MADATDDGCAPTASFGHVSPCLYVRFPVRRFRSPSVLWLNARWFAEQGVDVDDEGVQQLVHASILDAFAVSAPSHFDPSEGYAGRGTDLLCDRYGAPRGSMHGGSGRVGALGRLQAKGIGRTPLAATMADDNHSNGCLWLEEAIREAVFGEIAAAEFPFGAVPAVALIDTGEQLFWADGPKAPFRAILVRPEVMRLAHLQRSIHFGSAGFVGSDQERDGRRVRDAWRWFDGVDAHEAGAGGAAALEELFRRVGAQYGYAHVSGLWPGPFYSSNCALDGRLLDLGSMQALPLGPSEGGGLSARRGRGRGFGEEEAFVAAAARSIAALARASGARPPAPGDLLVAFRSGLLDGRRHALPDQGCAHPVLAADWDPSRARASATGIGQRLNDRPTLRFSRLEADAMALSGALVPGGKGNAAAVAAFIADRITSGRRTFPGLPQDFSIEALKCDTDWFWLACRTPAGTAKVHLRGTAVGERMRIANNLVHLPPPGSRERSDEGGYLLDPDASGHVTLFEQRLAPPPQLRPYVDRGT